MDVKMIAPGLIGLVLFIIIFNVYHIIKNRKKNMRRKDAVDAYKSNYKKNLEKKSEETDDYVRFITKYNSSVDFVDKDIFIEEAVKQGENQNRGIHGNSPQHAARFANSPYVKKKNGLHNNFM